jgi:hypothetical protein
MPYEQPQPKHEDDNPDESLDATLSTRRQHGAPKQHGRSESNNSCRMPSPPAKPDQPRPSTLLTRHRPDGGEVIGVEGVAQPKYQSDGKRNKRPRGGERSDLLIESKHVMSSLR